MSFFNFTSSNNINQGSDDVTTGAGYVFQTGIVTEFISEPEDFLDREAKSYSSLGFASDLLSKTTLRDILVKKTKEHDLNPREYVSNPEDAEIMPKNSILAYIIDNAKSKNGLKPFICFPFFPSHISLPVKPGEHVWILKEENYGRDIYYWMCRKPGIKQTEDVNYTHVERIEPIISQLDANREESELLIQDMDDRIFASFKNTSPSNLPEGITNDSIAFDSISYKEEFTSEPVPPIRKKCGDTLFQGSNNSHLHMTTEKFFYTSRNINDFAAGTSINQNLTGRSAISPAIDMCVGRKKQEISSLLASSLDKNESGGVKVIKSLRGKNYSSIETYEYDKTPTVKLENENLAASVDIDATNCGGRLYLSDNCAIDAAFGSSFDILPGYGGSSGALYSTHSRMIADGSLRLANRLGQSFLDMDPEGNVVIKSSLNNGQQFLYLRNNGVSRLQARDKIEFAVSSDNDDVTNSVNEPYVLYSELKDLLEKVTGDLAFYHTLIEEILLPAIPFGIGASIKQSLTTAREAAAAGGDVKIETPKIPGVEATDSAAAIPEIPAGTITVPSTLLGGNIKIDEYTEIAEQIGLKLPSKKIFGESND